MQQHVDPGARSAGRRKGKHKMMKTTKEFRMSRSPHTMLPGSDMAIFRVEHHSADWRADVESRMAVLQIRTTTDGWCDYLTIREPAEVAQIEQAIAAMPITTTTPVDAKLEAIFATYFPDGAHHAIEPSIRNAISAAFAAGRDFEGTRRDRRAERDAKADAQRAKDAKAMGLETITEEGGSR